MSPISIPWPIEALAAFPAIVFIVLVVIFPLIGLAAGWKKAAFWGGGNFIFFLIGMLVWRLAGAKIIAPFQDTIIQLLGELVQGLTVTPEMIVSILSPVWFILWMFIAEILLLINYFAWYKRAAHLKEVGVRDKKTGQIKVVHYKGSEKEFTTKYKIGNRLGGVALMGVLTLPTTITFAQTLYCINTSAATRATNKLSKNLYKGIEWLNDKAFNWMSFYPDTCHTYDAIFAGLVLYTQEITVTIDGEEVTGNALEVIEQTIIQDVSGMMENLDEMELSDLGEGINSLTDTWNDILDQCGESVEAIFNSGAGTDLIGQVIADQLPDDWSFGDDQYETMFGDGGTISQIAKEIEESSAAGQITIGGVEIKDLTQIDVSQGSIDNIVETFLGAINTEELSNPDEKIGDMKETIETLLSVIFNIK